LAPDAKGEVVYSRDSDLKSCLQGLEIQRQRGEEGSRPESAERITKPLLYR
jgi:hypothetical protein